MINSPVSGSESTVFAILRSYSIFLKAFCTGELRSPLYAYPYKFYKTDVLSRIRPQILMSSKSEFYMKIKIRSTRALLKKCRIYTGHLITELKDFIPYFG